jgi:uncharacterized membrane protein YfhO
MVYAPSKVGIITDSSERLSAMRRIDFNPYEQAYLSENPPSEMIMGKRNSKPKLNYALIQETLNQKIFEVKSNETGWFVFSDPDYPGWKAWVNEKPVSIFTVNHMFRGIYIPAGDHKVKFSFEPAWFRLISFGFLAWLLLTFLFWQLKSQKFIF